MGSIGYKAFDVEDRLARFSNATDATMRDVALSILMENGGDFQDAAFSCDTVVEIRRMWQEGVKNVSHSRDVLLEKWPDCADLIHAEVYGSDFCGED